MNERATTKKAGSIKTCALLVSFHLPISSYKKIKSSIWKASFLCITHPNWWPLLGQSRH